MRPDQIDLMTTISRPSVAPDGSCALVSATHPSFTVDGYVGQVFRVDLANGDTRRVTRGQLDTSPQFSPDGQLIAFLRNTEGKPQLAVVEAGGGEPLVITDAKLGVSGFSFSPDSTKIVYATRVPEPGRYGTLDDVPATAEDPRSFTGQKLQANGIGWVHDRPSQLFVVEVPDLAAEPPLAPKGRAAKAAAEDGAKSAGASDGTEPGATPPNPLVPQPRRLTEDRYQWSTPTFSADGTALLAVRDDPQTTSLTNELVRVPLDGGEPEVLVGAPMAMSQVAVTEQHIFFTGRDQGESGRDFVGHHPNVWVLPAAGGDPRRLTDLDVTVTGELLAVPGQEAVLFTEVWRGTSRVLRAGADGVVEQLSDGAQVAQGVGAGGDRVVASVATSTSMGEVAVVGGAGLQVLTSFGEPLASQTSVVEPVEFTATAADGYEIQGWVLAPSTPGPHPVLLNIHGGPYHAYDQGFFDEAQVHVAAGYAVVMCNPRGSWGYGTDHGRAVIGDFGNLAMGDVLSFFDQAIQANPSFDGSRVGVMGGSYGGYLTAWITSHDHRWAGAIVERGFLDPWSFNGSSDIGWFFGQEYTGYDKPIADAQSPMLLTDQVKTPTLVLHSELDLRCPLHQGLQYYAQLRQAGVDAELLVFPSENHELSRSGTPWHRRQRFEKMLAFWAKHLPVG